MKFECQPPTVATRLLEQDALDGVQGGITLGGLSMVRQQTSIELDGGWNGQTLGGPPDHPTVSSDAVSSSTFNPNNEDSPLEGGMRANAPPTLGLDPNEFGANRPVLLGLGAHGPRLIDLGNGPIGFGPHGGGPIGFGPHGGGPIGFGPNNGGPLGFGPNNGGPLGFGPNTGGPFGFGPNGGGPLGLGPNGTAPINGPIEIGTNQPNPNENVALDPQPIEIGANENEPNEVVALDPQPIDINANTPNGTAQIPNVGLEVGTTPNGALTVDTPNGSFGVSQQHHDLAIDTQSFSIQSFGDPHIQTMIDGVARAQIDYGPAIDDLVTFNNTVGGPTSISTQTYNLSGDQHITVNSNVTIESGPIGGGPETGYSIDVAKDGTVTMTDASGTRSVNTAGAPTTTQVGNATVSTANDHVVVEQTLLDGGTVVTEFDVRRGPDNVGNYVDVETEAVGNAGLGGFVLENHQGDSFATIGAVGYDTSAVSDQSTPVPATTAVSETTAVPETTAAA